MNEVFPTEYWPISSTIGSSRTTRPRARLAADLVELALRLSGRSLAAYNCLRDIKIDLSVSPSDVRPKPCIDLTSLAAAHATR